MWNWYVGQVAYSRFMARVFSTRGRDWRMLPTLANEQPAMVAYDRSGDHYQLHTLQVFTVERGAVVRTTVYQDPEVFAIFDLPKILPRGDSFPACRRYVPATPSYRPSEEEQFMHRTIVIAFSTVDGKPPPPTSPSCNWPATPTSRA